MTGRDYDHLQVFADVVRHGSFTAAAAVRGVGQPAISMQVRALEERLGVRLLERIGRKSRPTAAGRDLLVHARRLRQELEAAFDAMVPYREGRAGRLRIGAGATACLHLLPPILGQLRGRMPALEITVETGNTSDILRRVDENDLDVGIVSRTCSVGALAIRPIVDDELVRIAARAAGFGTAVSTPAELSGVPLALYEPGGDTRKLIDGWFEAASCAPRIAMQLGSVEAIKKLVAVGLCEAIVPAMAVEDSPDLVAAALDPPLRRILGLAIRRDKRLDRGLRELMSALAAVARPRGPIDGGAV